MTTHGSNMTAVPHTLCEWCNAVIDKLRPSFTHKLERDRLLFHYPDVDALLRGTLEQQCHMCSIFAGWAMRSQKASDISMALKRSGTVQDKRDKLLASIMKNAPMDSTDSWRAFDVFLGYIRDDETMDIVSRASLNYFKKGWGKKDVPPKMLTSFTGSQVSFDMIKKWLDVCNRDHPECRTDTRRRAPTRLLDLGREYTQDVRLVDGGTIDGAAYAALSYCWGLIPQLMLLPDNYSAFERNMPFEILSKVAQDAVTVCRAMSVRYLWIDALCIIQGPDGDFQQEASRMEAVYANALFTITAAASKDTSQAFLVHRDPLSWVDCQLREEQHDERYRSYIEGNPYCGANDNVPGTFPLDHRGWCFQEQFLSPRSIYYGAKGIHWECRRCVVCEHEHDMAHGHFNREPDPSRKSKFMELLSLSEDSTDAETNYKLRELWGDVVYRYTATQLTHQSDKLVALAGIAFVFQEKFKMTASFGLWTDFFLDEILWFHDARFEGDTVRHDLAPSWAWASLQDAQIYGANTLHSGETGEEQYLVDYMSATLVSVPDITGFMPLRHSARNEPGSSFRLRGYLTRCVHRPVKSRRGDRLIDRLDPLNGKDPDARQDVAAYYLDTLNEEVDLFCFLVRQEYRRSRDTDMAKSGDHDTVWGHGLVLTPVDASQNRFRRTGTFIEAWDIAGNTTAATDTKLSLLHTYLFTGTLEQQEIELV